jgi:hypothetical protein
MKIRILQRHRRATVYPDADSASLPSPGTRAASEGAPVTDGEKR